MNERIPVLFDRMLRPEWIDYALEQYVSCRDPVVHRQLLREYLRNQVDGEESKRKIVRQLQRSVGHLSTIPKERLERLYQEMSVLAPKDRTRIRLQVLQEATPFVADCVSALRRLHALGMDGVEIKHLYERLVERYGEREMVFRRVRYVLQTLVLLGIVRHEGRKWFLVDEANGL